MQEVDFLKDVDSIYEKIDLDSNSRLHQGDVLIDFEIKINTEGSELKKLLLPYCVIMSQDCDLSTDFIQRVNDNGNNNGYIPNILICPAYNYERFLLGEHIDGWVMKNWNIADKDPDKNQEISQEQDKKNRDTDRINLRRNEKDRYHFLNGDSLLQVPNLVVDFKHFYTVPREYLYGLHKSVYLVTIKPLFREKLSQRFAFFLSRFGLPEIKKSKSGK